MVHEQLAELQPPPPLENPADLQMAHEWLQTERARLVAYTRSQFAALQQQTQSLLDKQFRGEEALALRAQELNREMKFLASQSEALQSRARELADREAALATQMERLASVEQELLSSEMRGEPEAHRALVERLRTEMAQLQAAGVDAGNQAAALETALKERQQAWEQKQATLVARQGEIEQRFAVLVKAEAASQRRLAELDEVEQLLRKEFEQEENRLIRERQEIDVLRARLRTQIRKLEEGVDEFEEDAVPV
jgi:chromosome segregation ATPase